MRLVRLAAMCVLLATSVAGCADSDSDPSGAGILPPGSNRDRAGMDYYGRSSGYIDPNACWRSTAPALCY